MRKITFIFLAISACLLLCCTSKDDFQQARVLDSVFSVNELEFDPLGESVSLTYSSDVNWRISYPNWLTVTPSSGSAGTYEITVQANLNTSWAQRSGSIVVDEHQISVLQDCPYLRINYSTAAEETLHADDVPVTTVDRPSGEASVVYAWNHSSRSSRNPLRISVSSNIEWEIVTEDGFEGTYFSADGNTSDGVFPYEGNLTFNLFAEQNNYAKEDFETRVTIRPKAQGGHDLGSMSSAAATYHLDLTQEHLVFLIDGEADDATVEFDELGYVLDAQGAIRQDSSYVFSSQIECEIPWQVQLLDEGGTPIGSSFVTSNINGGNGGEDPEEIRMEIPTRYNPYEEERRMIVRLSAADGEATRDFQIVQRPYIFEINGDAAADTSFDNGELSENGETAHTITIRTTGSWYVYVPAVDYPWLKVDPATSSGKSSPGNPQTYTVRFWADSQNLHLVNDAVSLLRFQAENGHDKSVEVTQEPFLLEADYNAAQLSNLSATRTAERFEVDITASNAWKLLSADKSPLSAEDWYAVSEIESSSPSYGYPIWMGAATVNDNATNSKSKVILLTSDIHEALSTADQRKWAYEPVRISLVQRPFTFRINGKSAGESNSMTIPAYRRTFDDSLNIESDGDWEIVSCPSWIHPAASSGTSDIVLQLNPDINLETTARSAGTVRVNCLWDGTVRNTIDVSVSQEGIVFNAGRQESTSLTGIAPDVNFEGHRPLSYSFSVSATDELPWILGSTNGAFIAPVTNRTGSGSVTVSPTYNADRNNGRSADVYITLNTSADSRISPVYVERFRDLFNWHFEQDKYVFDDSTPAEAFFRSQATLKSGSDNVSFECSGPWTISSCPNWVHPQTSGGASVSSGESNPSFRLVVDQNTTQSVRGTSYVVVTSRIGGYTKQIPVRQDQYYYGFTTSGTLTFPTMDATEQRISFRSSGSWTLNNLNASEWGASALSGSGNDDGGLITVTLKPRDNTSLETDRSTAVTLSSGNFSNSSVSLYQPHYVFSMDKTAISFESPFYSQCPAQSVNVNCTGSWKATSNQSWLTITNDSRTGNGVFSVSVNSDNLTTSALDASITIVTTYNGVEVARRTIPVSQVAYVFNLSANSHEFDKNGGSVNITINSSGSWVVTKTKDDDNMISNFTGSGNGNGTITITANSNTGRNAKQKTAELQVKCQNSDNLVKTISLTQKN